MRSKHNPVTLATGVTQYSGLARVRELIKLQVRSVVHRTATARWIGFLNGGAFYADLARMNPYLIRKIYRSYLDNTMNCMQRVAALIGHYSFVRAHGWGPMVLQAARAPVLLAAFPGKSGLRYRLVLETGLSMEREGDLILRLLRERDLVCSCAFSFLQHERMCIAVGGMQGPPRDGLALMRETTRDLFGLRPKHFMVKLLGVLGERLGCDKLYLVSNARHAAIRPRREGRVRADYDRLWIECGALPRPDGNFDIRCMPLQPPDLAALPSKRRSLAHHRHACLRAIVDSIATTLPTAAVDAAATRNPNDTSPDAHRVAPAAASTTRLSVTTSHTEEQS